MVAIVLVGLVAYGLVAAGTYVSDRDSHPRVAAPVATTAASQNRTHNRKAAHCGTVMAIPATTTTASNPPSSVPMPLGINCTASMSWLARKIRPHVGDEVLEIGAGIGNITGRLIGKRAVISYDEFLRAK